MNRNIKRFLSKFGALVLLSPAMIFASEATASETHKMVKQALAWQMPDNSCKKPLLSGNSTDIINNNGITLVYDVDSYKLGRYNRKMKRWNKCINKYRQGLANDFDTLKSSAHYELTQDQANQILTKMASIQARIITLAQN